MSEQKKHEENTGKEDQVDKKKNNLVYKIRQHPMFTEMIVLAVIVLMAAGILIYSTISSRIAVDNAEVYTPTISLAPQVPGVLDKIYVSEGDIVSKHQTVASIGGNPLKTASDGIITSVKNTPGAIVSSANPIIEMINPDDLRVIGHIDEDKGLSDVKVGQRVKFTIDAFGSKEYDGVVEEISPSARQQDIVFSISNARQVKQFDIKVKYDVEKYPQIKNGMSARMKIYKY